VALEAAMNPDELASGAILITLWAAQVRRTGAADAEAALAAVRPICDMITEIVDQDGDRAVREALRRASDDDHAKATLQRHVADALQAEPALVSELLRRLLEIGEVRAGEGITQIDISLSGPDGRTGMRVSISLPWPSDTLSRLTPPVDYVGRVREIEQVLTAAESAAQHVRVVAITGPPGQGRTAFARAIAGHMYQGKTARVQLELPLSQRSLSSLGGLVPRPPGDVLFEALLALGVATGDIPVGLAERAALYRARLSEAVRRSATRPLILLDDARDFSQLPYFRPACPGIVLVTGDRLDGGQASVFDLEPLDARESFQLLTSRMDPDHAGPGRGLDDLAALERLVRLCSGVPLAVAIMAGVLEVAIASGEAPAALAGEMHRAYSATTNTAPLAALALSYRRLTTEQRRVLNAMTLLGVPAFDVNVIAAACGLSGSEARIVIDQLVRRSLVEPFGAEGNRWRLHQVVFGFVSRLPDPVAAERERILTDAARLYQRRAQGLADLLGVPSVASDPGISAWAEEQMHVYRPALLALLWAALDAGLAQVARILAASVIELAGWAGDSPELDRSMEAVIATARATADTGVEARALHLLSRQAKRHGQHRPAAELRDRARAVRREAESQAGAASDGGESASSPDREAIWGEWLPGDSGDARHGRRRRGDWPHPAEGGVSPDDDWTPPNGEPKDGPDRPGSGGSGPGGSGPGGSGPGGSGPGGSGPGGSGPGGSGPGGSGPGGPRPGGSPAGSPSAGGGSSQASPGLRASRVQTAISQGRGGTAPTTQTTFGTERGGT
jgi:hypothetical protein